MMSFHVVVVLDSANEVNKPNRNLDGAGLADEKGGAAVSVTGSTRDFQPRRGLKKRHINTPVKLDRLLTSNGRTT